MSSWAGTQGPRPALQAAIPSARVPASYHLELWGASTPPRHRAQKRLPGGAGTGWREPAGTDSSTQHLAHCAWPPPPPQEQLPDLNTHFRSQSFHTSMYASSWFLTLFLTTFPLPVATRVFDIFMYEVRTTRRFLSWPLWME